MSHRAQTKVGDGDAGIARFELAQRRRRHAQPGGEILCHLPAVDARDANAPSEPQQGGGNAGGELVEALSVRGR
jgi:hypothetical protein